MTWALSVADVASGSRKGRDVANSHSKRTTEFPTPKSVYLKFFHLVVSAEVNSKMVKLGHWCVVAIVG